jgi:4-amino-4-deoxychorismate lyase
MSLFIESIKLLEGEYANLFYHEQRMKRSLWLLCGVHDNINLEEYLQRMHRPKKGLFKCRIVYDDVSRQVEFTSYQQKKIESLKVIEHDRIYYEYKFKDRSDIDRLFAQRGQSDDILIVRQGMVTDTSFCNIAFKKDDAWFTPSTPLLEGTMRQSLLDKRIIQPALIQKQDIHSFQSFKLINSMIGFDGPEIDVSKIVF